MTDFYKIIIKRSAEKELRHVPKVDLARMMLKIKNLSFNPRPVKCEMLKGEDRYFRIRQGDYRIVYEVNDQERIINVTKIGHRREVYG